MNKYTYRIETGKIDLSKKYEDKWIILLTCFAKYWFKKNLPIHPV